MIVYTELPEKFPSANDTRISGSAVALGMFDGLHRGHLAVLNALRETSGGLTRCVFTFSTSAAKPDAKAGGRLISADTRDELLKRLGVDYVLQPEFLSFKDMSPEAFANDFLLGYMNAKAVFCGEDFKFGKAAAATARDLGNLLSGQAEVKVIPTVLEDGGAVSTTRIRKLIMAGDMRKAAELLGRVFRIDFTVEHGRRLGRTLNWPTINQRFPGDFVVPKFGVYASVTTIDGARRTSVTNVGVKPTVGSDGILAETYIHGFSGDLYGQKVPVELVEFIREERKFSGIDELKARIKQDNELAITIIGG